jgi:ribonucleoside-diphosphate reductase alpha chain
MSSEGLKIKRLYTTIEKDVLDAVEWKKFTACVTGKDGKVVFKQEDVEFPAYFSQLAVNVVSSKYFRGTLGTPEREKSFRRVIERVVNTITGWGRARGYFPTMEDERAFEQELKYLLVHQKASFNSPVWFNFGLDTKPQASACFINSVHDNMESIMQLATTEAMLFKGGSGSGTNLSEIRSSKEVISGGGTPSGPVSFMKGYDSFAGVIKSGGKTRRAAKIAILDVDHPDVVEFIQCKANEERKARVLIAAGYDDSMDGEAYRSVAFQNSNNSVRMSNAFMHSVVDDREWELVARTTGEVLEKKKARDILREMALAAHQCGDPGFQFDDTINAWNTCAASGHIRASNPCGEFHFLDESACNLSSLNLLGFWENGFKADEFIHAVDVLIIAQDIIVDDASYPTEMLGENAHKFRPLGLGYANLGALLMEMGEPYDSDRGRDFASNITALMTGEAYRMSHELAKSFGAFEEYKKNVDPMNKVVLKHVEAVEELGSGSKQLSKVWGELRAIAKENLDKGEESIGFRNAQVTLIAPTGTIAFMMDCSTTGIEPEMALVKTKVLVGGGFETFVNQSIFNALKTLGYSKSSMDAIHDYIMEHRTHDGAPHLSMDHYQVFDCAMSSGGSERVIDHMGHLKMLAAVQPFISGAISKTVNLPSQITIGEIEEIIVKSWRMGIKNVCVYRDGSKSVQPIDTKGADSNGHRPDIKSINGHSVWRRRLPDERVSVTHKFSVGGHEGYITVGLYEDGTPGEMFIKMAKGGSVVSGLMDSFALAISMSLQYGVPLPVLVEKYSHTRFEPSGFTTNEKIPMAKSIVDYLFRWMGGRFCESEEQEQADVFATGRESLVDGLGVGHVSLEDKQVVERTMYQKHSDAPLCLNCGMLMTRAGACYKCDNCGASGGCG